MKNVRFLTALVLFCIAVGPAGFSQNKKLDKTLKKVDGYYKAGSFSKALKSLNKFKNSAKKLGPNSNYMVEFYLREANINLASGIVAGFETSLTNALTTSLAVYGENSTSYASTMLDVADIYIEYGNFR